MGITDPCNPEVRTWWLSRVEDIIRAGADGMDIRLTTHSENLDWENYSFSGLIVEEFRRRYGVDITREPFSREAWRRLRGEYFDLFLQQASELVHQAGKRLQCQFHRWIGFEPDGNTFMETAWNWKQWIQRGILDEVLLRGLDFEDPLFHAVQTATESAGLPLYAEKPIVHPAGPVVADFIRRCQQLGMDGANLYEGASLLRLCADGEFTVLDPSIVETCFSHPEGMRTTAT